MTWNIVVTSLLLLLGSVQLLPHALATIGDFTELLQGKRLELKGSSTGFDVLLQGWDSDNDEAIYLPETGGLWLGYETQSGILDIRSTYSNALSITQGGQTAPMFRVQASSNGTGKLELRTENSTAFSVVDDSTGDAVFSVGTGSTGEVHSAAPIRVDTIATHTVGGDLVFELR